MFGPDHMVMRLPTSGTSFMVATTVSLDPDTQARVQRLAASRDRPADIMVREAVEQYVEREEAREQFRQDALKACADLEATGLHLTGEEADAWFARLEAREDAPQPECHT